MFWSFVSLYLVATSQKEKVVLCCSDLLVGQSEIAHYILFHLQIWILGTNKFRHHDLVVILYEHRSQHFEE